MILCLNTSNTKMLLLIRRVTLKKVKKMKKPLCTKSAPKHCERSTHCLDNYCLESLRVNHLRLEVLVRLVRLGVRGSSVT